MRKTLPFLLAILLSVTGFSQKKKNTPEPFSEPVIKADEYFSAMRFRNIGPSRGGRVTAVTGIPSKPYTFLMGSTGGGVWLTDDGGTSWKNISDGFFKTGSIGCIRVAPSDPNVIYVGTGSADPRGNVSIGKGIYRSVDGGKSWVFGGLENGGQIGSMEVDPRDPNIVYAALLGNPFGKNKERGVYKSTDGGISWNQVLYVNDSTGAMDIVMDPNNPRILYAAMWQVQRKPWTLIDGGPEGGVWRSKDAGTTWEKLTTHGLPGGLLGKISVAISPGNSNRIWVLLETPDNETGGLYRSDDGGISFQRINGDRRLRMRAWYYNHVYADPKDAETVYVNNVEFLKSTDGGKSFTPIRVLHGDCHDLWISPVNTDIMIHGNDGGAHVTFNGGKAWSTLNNQTTAELYRVSVDNQFPYRVYACQQDNTSISVPSATRNWGNPLQDWQQHDGGESGYVAIDPRNPNITYAGNYTGIVDRLDRSQGHGRTVTHYPQMHDGMPLYKVKYRYQWNAPMRISPHDPNVLYHASQYVHKTTDEGKTWTLISPDLTTNKKEYQEIPGGPIQHDYTGVENYTTIFALEESTLQPGEIWAGTDDGLVHVTMDGGKTWKNVTPPGLPPLATVNSIDISTHKKGKVFVAVHNYRQNDFKPYIFKTENFGQSWTLVSNWIPSSHPVRVVREDPNREGLLYAGTEYGLFVSLDDGKYWHEFQRNLPITPITDLLIKNNDLVLSTQGRSFWILDDLSPLHQWKDAIKNEKMVLFTPEAGIRTQLTQGYGTPNIYFHLKNKPDSSTPVHLKILDNTGKVLCVYTTAKPDANKQERALLAGKGLNVANWDLTSLSPVVTPGSIFSMAGLNPAKVPTGSYKVRLIQGSDSTEKELLVKQDPRWKSTDADLKAQYDLTMQVQQSFNESHEMIRTLRNVRTQSNDIVARAEKVGKGAGLKKQAETMNKKLSDLEAALIQTQHKSYQDPINYPPKFDDQLAWLYDIVQAQDARPTQGCYDLYNDLRKELEGYKATLNNLLETDVKSFNEQVLKDGVGGVVIHNQ